MRTFIPFVMLAVLGCASDQEHRQQDKWEPIPMEHAEHFRLFARGAQRMAIVFGPGGTADTAMVLCMDTPAADLPSRAVALPDLERLAVLSTTHLSYISALGEADRVVAAAHLDHVRDRATRSHIAQDGLREIATADGVGREQLLASQAQVVLDYPFGQTAHRAAGMEHQFIPITEYLEEHPLGRAEWIRFFGVLLDREEKADSIYAAIAERYDKITGHIPTTIDRPEVFFGSSWQGQWHVPPGNSYMARLIADAGGEYLFKDRNSSGNIAIDIETLIAEARKADRFGTVLAHGGDVHVIDVAGGDSRVAKLAVMVNGAFCLDSEHSDIFGEALLEPDVLLSELVSVLHDSLSHGSSGKYVIRPHQ